MQRYGRVVRASDMKSGDPEFKFRSDHQLDLLQVFPRSTPWLRIYVAKWFASRQLRFLDPVYTSRNRRI